MHHLEKDNKGNTKESPALIESFGKKYGSDL